MLGKIEDERRKGTRDDEMVGWHHRINEHESEQTPGDSEEQGSLVCCSPWGSKELDMTGHTYTKSQTRALRNRRNKTPQP